MFFARSLIGATSQGNSAVEVSANTLLLDGSTQYLTADDNANLDMGDADKSHSIWFKTGSAGTHIIFSKGDQSNNAYYDIFIEGGVVNARIRTAIGANIRHYRTNSAAFADDAWHHVVVRWNNFGTYEIIIDNVNQALNQPSSDAISGPFNTSDDVYIGAIVSTVPVGFYSGSLANIMMFNTTITDTEVTALYNGGVPKQPWLLSTALKSDAVLLLPLNSETDSNEYSDYSGNANDATATGSPTITGASLTIVNSTDTGP